MDTFSKKLAEHKIELNRSKTTTLQINVGLQCNLSCKHCHLSAGPGRKENMTLATAQKVVSFARKWSFQTIDITGGAPELNQNLPYLIENLAPCANHLILRSNLTLLGDEANLGIIDLCRQHRVIITASFPAISELQADSQRGEGVFGQSLAVLKKLNNVGYGVAGSGLELNLVSNPTGAFMPTSQRQLEQRFKEILFKRWGIVCSNVYTFANVPLGRFQRWLEKSGNLETYMEKLSKAFNPCAVEGVMCRSILSVGWDGLLYDCDFNIAAALPLGGVETCISDISAPPDPGSPIAVSDHCFACTAGAGFT